MIRLASLLADGIAARWFSSRSIVTVTSSLTTGSDSIRLFQSMPNSLRLIFVVADAPVRTLVPRWPSCVTTGDGPSTSSTTSFVLPRIVRSPTSLNLPAAPGSTRLDLNVSVGCFATSKKSALLRCVVATLVLRVDRR